MQALSLTEEDIRPKKLMELKLSALEADRQFLLSQKHRWDEVPCPVCGEQTQVNYGEKDGCCFVACPACSMIYMSPRPAPSLLHEYYSKSQNYALWNKYIFPATENTRYTAIHEPRARFLVDQCIHQGMTDGSFLEIGAAHGSFLRAVNAINFFDEITALEPTYELAKTCQAQNFNVINSTIEDYKTDKRFNVISAFEVLEHLYNPAYFLKCCANLLYPKGLLALSCPNIDGFDVRIMGVTAPCFQYGHLNYFCRASIAFLLFKNGFSLTSFSTPGKLDTDIVIKAILSGTINSDKYKFLNQILLSLDKNTSSVFQSMIASLDLSSHMLIIATKQ